MKINRKDLLSVYFIGILMMLIGSFILMSTEISLLAQFTMWAFFLIPGVYYFYRNHGYELVEAAKVSALFGFTFLPVYFLLLIVPFGFIEFLVFPGDIDLANLALVDWGLVLLAFAQSGVILSIITMLAYLLVEKLSIRTIIPSEKKGKKTRK